MLIKRIFIKKRVYTWKVKIISITIAKAKREIVVKMKFSFLIPETKMTYYIVVLSNIESHCPFCSFV